MEDVYNKLIEYIEKTKVLLNEPMANHTTFKIGGPADIFVKVNNIDELKVVLDVVKNANLPLTVIGNGSNVLVKDNGIRGVTVKLNLQDISVNNDEIEVGSGVLLSKLARVACDNELSGLEFASGIPGTVGGAIYMNAGAYGGEFKDIVLRTTYIDEDGNLHTVSNDEQQFSYRKSLFSNNNNYIIANTVLKLHKSTKEEILNKMNENNKNRKEKQPVELPSAGSVFKRKDEYIPAQLIDKCNLKGYNIGDAYVSEKHAGFIVNKGNATANDVLKLVEYIKTTVYEKYKVNIELEMKVIGE